MAIYSSVDCEEVFGSVKETFTPTTRSASVQLRCAWANRGALMQDLLSTPRLYPASATMVALKASTAPYETKYTTDVDGQIIIYEDAIVTVEYGIPGDDKKQENPDDPTNLISEKIEPYTKVITLDYENFEWTADGTDLKSGEEPGKVIHGIRLTREIFYVTVIDPGILNLPGTINDRSYFSGILGMTFATGTLLFLPPVISRTATILGAKAWTLSLGWDYNSHGWNNVWRMDTQTWGGISLKGGGPYESYEEANQTAFLF